MEESVLSRKRIMAGCRENNGETSASGQGRELKNSSRDEEFQFSVG